MGGGARSLEHFCNPIRLSQIERVEDRCHQSQQNSDTGNEESEIIVGHRLALADRSSVSGIGSALPCEREPLGACAIVNRREVGA